MRAAEGFQFALVTIRTTGAKNGGVVGNAFGVLALVVAVRPDKVGEHALIRIASLLLSVHVRAAVVTQNTVSFLYECSQAGLVQGLKDVKPVLPTVMTALQIWAEHEVIMERAVALAFLLEHHNGEKLLRAAVTQFPESRFLASIGYTQQ
jgi:hypothetical protein